MQYFEPNFLDEALVLLERFGASARPIAGATLVGPQLRADASGVEALVNLKRIDDLSSIALDGDGALRIGALATVATLAAHPLVRAHAALLADAAASVGARQLRNVATLGGNLLSRHHAADAAVALTALDAECVVSGLRDGERVAPMAAFVSARQPLEDGELLLAVRVPARRTRHAYEKMTTRRAFEMALVAVAVAAGDTGTRIALGGAAPSVVRATAAETALTKGFSADAIVRAARAAADHDAAPSSDERAGADYRRHLVRVLVERALRRIAASSDGAWQ